MVVKVGFKELAKSVIEQDICSGCGACIVVCPYKGLLEYSDGNPKEVGECKVCGICSRVCPRYTASIEELEKFLFGRTRKPEEVFGVYKDIYAAKSTDDEILRLCQDGGVVSTIINTALESGMIDGAVISGVDPSVPWFPIPFIAANRKDILQCSGTRYTYSPNLFALKQCIDEGLMNKVAFVGTPCQILAFRRIQKLPLKKFSKVVAFTVGLFCSESFTYSGLMVEKIRDEMGIDLNNLEKINIKGKMLLSLTGGQVVEIPLKEVKKYAENKCKYCSDFSAELADISVGGVGLTGRTFTVVRTNLGEKILKQALGQGALDAQSANEFERAYNLLTRLSNLKHQNLQNKVK